MSSPTGSAPDDLAAAFAAATAEGGDRPFLIEDDRELSWAEVAGQVERLARGFLGEGLTPGDRIAIDLPNGIEWVVTLLAAARAGLTVVPLDPGLGYHELKYQLRHAEVAAVMIPEEGGTFDYLELFDELLPQLPALLLIGYVGPGERWFDDRGVPFAELLRRGGHVAAEPERPRAGTTLTLIYTSGTMGKPKGVLLTHHAMLSAARATRHRSRLGPGDRMLLAVPLFHAFGIGALLTAVEARATVVLLPRFEPGAALAAIGRQGVTHLPGVPTMFELMMRSEEFTASELATLRGGVVGGAAVSPEAVDRIRRWCDVEIAYGLTETGPTVAMTGADDPPDRRRSTVGRLVEGMESVVVDLQRGTHHGVDAVGELAVRGASLMQGYHRMPGETANSFTRDGFLLTGDLVHVDEQGFISVIARRRSVIIRAGQTITPREIEDVLRTHPGVEDACVVGLPHPVLGELVAACVVPVEGATLTGPELRRFCQDMLAASKVPDLVRFLDAFPMTSSGKVRRVELARTLATSEG